MERYHCGMKSTAVIGRFAPSPTGPLHFGSLVAALASYLDTRAGGGRWRLRIDDVDQSRSRATAIADIPASLAALGLHWDGPIQQQSSRTAVYAEALAGLIRAEQAYPCGCTRREVAAQAERGPAGMIYPGTCRAGLGAHRPARSWRFRVNDTPIRFVDRALGVQTTQLDTEVGDFVIRRADSLYAYHLAMVLDDATLGVTDVVRGADLLPATAPQIALQQALGLPTPRYLHVPVVYAADGRKLSKTNAAAPVDTHQPIPALRQALEFLNQPLPEPRHTLRVDELLDWAIRHWTPSQCMGAKA